MSKNNRIDLFTNADGGIVNIVKTTLTPTGHFEKDKTRGEEYAKKVGMDDANTKMAVVMATQGTDAGGKQMVREFTTPKGHFDYEAMRNMYG